MYIVAEILNVLHTYEECRQIYEAPAQYQETSGAVLETNSLCNRPVPLQLSGKEQIGFK